jgi:hypothetical protein
MRNSEAVTAKYRALLKELDFDRKYYEYALATRNPKAVPAWNEAEWRAVLDDLGLTYTFRSKEKLFRIDRSTGSCRIALMLAHTNNSLEAILSIDAPDEFSNPFPVLAYALARERDAQADPKPPYPKLSYSNPDELRAAVKFCVNLFSEVEQRVLAANGC